MTFKRGDKWAAKATDPRTGRQVWLGTFATKAEAQKAETVARWNAEAGLPLKMPTLTFAQFADEIGSEYEASALRPSTKADYKNTLEHLSEAFGPGG